MTGASGHVATVRSPLEADTLDRLPLADLGEIDAGYNAGKPPDLTNLSWNRIFLR